MSPRPTLAVDPVPIGLPFPATTFTVDPDNPGSSTGELIVAGPGVAIGYVNDAANPKFSGTSLIMCAAMRSFNS
jgi:hypothetical protein